MLKTQFWTTSFSDLDRELTKQTSDTTLIDQKKVKPHKINTHNNIRGSTSVPTSGGKKVMHCGEKIYYKEEEFLGTLSTLLLTTLSLILSISAINFTILLSLS